MSYTYNNFFFLTENLFKYSILKFLSSFFNIISLMNIF